MEPTRLTILALVTASIAAGGVALGLSLRRRQSAAERERARRLRVNAIGRICDGSIVEVTERMDGGSPVRLLHFSYSVGGVTYSAAQDISTLRHVVHIENCSEGVPASVKYDPQNPSNSIVVCELWSGLRQPGPPVSPRRQA